MYSIHDFGIKIKRFFNIHQKDLLISLVIIFTSILSFYIGKSSNNELNNENIYIVNKGGVDSNMISVDKYTPNSDLELINKDTYIDTEKAIYVASSRGKLYYRIGCGGSTQLSEANKIFFKTQSEAESMGYTPAKNCVP